MHNDFLELEYLIRDNYRSFLISPDQKQRHDDKFDYLLKTLYNLRSLWNKYANENERLRTSQEKK
jgi:hypothetical protein